MRVVGLGLLAVGFMTMASSANAGRVSEGPATALEATPEISVELGNEIALGNLISPSMLWSQLEIDNLKAEGLNSSLPYSYTAELAVKSDLIRSFHVAQTEQMAPPHNHRSNDALVGFLMLTAGFTMWFGLTLQRKY